MCAYTVCADACIIIYKIYGISLRKTVHDFCFQQASLISDFEIDFRAEHTRFQQVSDPSPKMLTEDCWNGGSWSDWQPQT